MTITKRRTLVVVLVCVSLLVAGCSSAGKNVKNTPVESPPAPDRPFIPPPPPIVTKIPIPRPSITPSDVGTSVPIPLGTPGKVWSWGGNRWGQLGNGSTINSNSPGPVTNLEGVIAISGGLRHSLALESDGSVWAWGLNNSGQLAQPGSRIDSSLVPIHIDGLDKVIAITAGGAHNLALKSDGTLWAWGYNYCGQLGIGVTGSRSFPIQVVGLSNVEAMAANYINSYALTSDGTLWGWGDNSMGQLGIGTRNDTSIVPVQVSGIDEVIAIASGSYFTLALRADGSVWSWGYNKYGQLGSAPDYPRLIPAQVSGIENVIGIAAGWNHSIALKSDGTVWSIGRKIERVTGMDKIVMIRASENYNLALKSDGSVWIWGVPPDGRKSFELDGYPSFFPTPIRVQMLSNVTSISAGADHCIAITVPQPFRN